MLRAPLLPSLVWVSETSAFFIYYYFFGARRALTAYLNGSIGALTLAAAVLFSTVRAQLGCGQPAASSAAQKTHRRDPRPAAAPASPSRPAGLLPPLPRPHMASPAPPARAVGSLPPLGNGARRGGGAAAILGAARGAPRSSEGGREGRGGEKSRAERGSAALLLPPLPPPPPPQGRAEPSARRTQSGARTSGGAAASPQPGLRAAPHLSALPCRSPPAACCCWPRCSAEEPRPLEVNRAAGGRGCAAPRGRGGRRVRAAGLREAGGAQCPSRPSRGTSPAGGGRTCGAVTEGRRRGSPARPQPGGRSVLAGRALT